MAEETPSLVHLEKGEAYDVLEAQLVPLLAACGDAVAAMATFSCLVHHAFGHLWTGFYRVVAPGRLRVGPYQGTLGCLEIDFGPTSPRIGVCGTAAREGRTIVVADVHAFPGHIACDARARAEIVVPVFSPDGALAAVLDVDATTPGAFTGLDARRLEGLVRALPPL